MSFSDRMGITQPRETLQIDSIDTDLANLLWNALIEIHLFKAVGYQRSQHYQSRYTNIWVKFFKKPKDTIPPGDSYCIKKIREWFFEAEWYDKYNFIQFIRDSTSESFEIEINKIFVQEKSGYRFVEGFLIPLTDGVEIQSIGESISLDDKYSGARKHIKNAAEAFSKKPNIDYTHVIKEAISGVESIAKVITQDDKATLGQALNELEKTKPMHPAFKEGFKKLYGYTSDEQGIRHAYINEDSNVTESDAHFMIVICSAFINFAVAHYQTN